jgi:hypothetical protein
VTVANAGSLPSDYVTLIQTAVLAQFNGQNGNTPAGIASLILALSYTGAIFAAVPGVSLVSVLVGLSGPATLYDVTMGIDQQPTLDSSNVTVSAI